MKYKFLSGQKCDNFFLKINFGNYRLSFTRSTRLTAMCGAMVWCCLRSGQSGRSHSHSTQTVKLLSFSSPSTTSPLPLDAQELFMNSWLTAGK